MYLDMVYNAKLENIVWFVRHLMIYLFMLQVGLLEVFWTRDGFELPLMLIIKLL